MNAQGACTHLVAECTGEQGQEEVVVRAPNRKPKGWGMVSCTLRETDEGSNSIQTPEQEAKQRRKRKPMQVRCPFHVGFVAHR